MHSSVILLSDIDHLVVKHNNLIESKMQLSEVENKVVSLAIVLTRLHARNTERDMKIDSTIRIYASDYVKTYSVTTKAAYHAINDAMDSLFERTFTMPSSKGVPTDYRWIQSKGKGTKLNDGFVEFTFSEKAVELITNLNKGNYTSYGIERISRLKGNYSGRIYELIVKYKNTEADKKTNQRSTKIFEIESFRELIGVEDHEYRDKKKPNVTRIDNFKVKVIDKSIDVINLETDIIATAIYHRTGRSITSISFDFEFKADYVPAFMRNSQTVAEGKKGNEIRTVKGVTTDVPADAPKLPSVKNDTEHLGTDIRKEDLATRENKLAIDLQGAINAIPSDFKPDNNIPDHLYAQYVDQGGTKTKNEIIKESIALDKQPSGYISFLIFSMIKAKKNAG